MSPAKGERMILPLMSYEPTPEERVRARRTRRALLERMGLIIKELADLFGKPERYIDDQLRARRPLGNRWDVLDGFSLAYAEVIAEEHDAFLIEKRYVRLIEVELSPKRMARATLDVAEDERKRA